MLDLSPQELATESCVALIAKRQKKSKEEVLQWLREQYDLESESSSSESPSESSSSDSESSPSESESESSPSESESESNSSESEGEEDISMIESEPEPASQPRSSSRRTSTVFCFPS